MDDRAKASFTRKPKGDRVGKCTGSSYGRIFRRFKMTALRYQEPKAPEIPELTDDDGTKARPICEVL
jgi:hypothetical protein